MAQQQQQQVKYDLTDGRILLDLTSWEKPSSLRQVQQAAEQQRLEKVREHLWSLVLDGQALAEAAEEAYNTFFR